MGPSGETDVGSDGKGADDEPVIADARGAACPAQVLPVISMTFVRASPADERGMVLSCDSYPEPP